MNEGSDLQLRRKLGQLLRNKSQAAASHALIHCTCASLCTAGLLPGLQARRVTSDMRAAALRLTSICPMHYPLHRACAVAAPAKRAVTQYITLPYFYVHVVCTSSYGGTARCIKCGGGGGGGGSKLADLKLLRTGENLFSLKYGNSLKFHRH